MRDVKAGPACFFCSVPDQTKKSQSRNKRKRLKKKARLFGSGICLFLKPNDVVGFFFWLVVAYACVGGGILSLGLWRIAVSAVVFPGSKGGE